MLSVELAHRIIRTDPGNLRQDWPFADGDSRPTNDRLHLTINGWINHLPLPWPGPSEFPWPYQAPGRY